MPEILEAQPPLESPARIQPEMIDEHNGDAEDPMDRVENENDVAHVFGDVGSDDERMESPR